MALIGGDIDDVAGPPIHTPWTNGADVSVSLGIAGLATLQSVTGAAISIGIASGNSAIITATTGTVAARTEASGLSATLTGTSGTGPSSTVSISSSGVLTFSAGTSVSRTTAVGVSPANVATYGAASSASRAIGDSTVRLFSPSDITSPALGIWFKGDSLSGADMDPVSSWTDSSGGAHPATQSTPSLRPVYRTSGINSQPGVQFAGTAVLTTTYTPLLTTPYTAFVVMNFSTSHNGVLFGTANPLNGADGDFVRIRDNAGTPQLRVGSGGVFYDVAITTGTRMVTVTNASTSSGSGTLTSRIDGVTLLTQTVSRSTVTNHGVYVGSLMSNAANQALQGTIAEIIFYTGVLSNADRDKVEAYLRTKYSLP